MAYEALKAAKKRNGEFGEWEFTSNEEIKCPHCGECFTPSTLDDSDFLYEEGLHEAECPYCEYGFQVNTFLIHIFSTSMEFQKKEDRNNG